MTGYQESKKQRPRSAITNFLIKRSFSLSFGLIFFFTGTFCVLWYTFNSSSSDRLPSSPPPSLSPETVSPPVVLVNTEAPSSTIEETGAPTSQEVFTEAPSQTPTISTLEPSASTVTNPPSDGEPEPTAAPTSATSEPPPKLELVGNSTSNPELFPLRLCEGHCGSDVECDFGLVCIDPRNQSVPGCVGEIGGEAVDSGFCATPTDPNTLVVQGFGGQPEAAFPLGVCEGSCRKNNDCQENLECYKKSDMNDTVPGCLGEGVAFLSYCIASPQTTEPSQNLTTTPTSTPTAVTSTMKPSPSLASTPSPSSQPSQNSTDTPPTSTPAVVTSTMAPSASLASTPSPTAQPSMSTPPPTTDLLNQPVSTVRSRPLRMKKECTEWSRCRRCEGNCENDSRKCKKGLVCVQRTDNEAVDGCTLGGSGDVSGSDYCIKPSASVATVSYIPGDRTLIESGLLLSTGLTARIIATKDQNVQYVGGGESEEVFHVDPDGAAVFADDETGGWIYVSNAESSRQGGVGAITFNSNGDVVGYKRVLDEGVTRRNCGGGKTFWNTWLTCEEDEGGQVWEVDPWGERVARQTLLGGAGDKYESAAYDNRDITNPSFYVTTDTIEGAIVKFSPDRSAITEALSTDPPEYSNLLHTNRTGTARLQYLVLEPRKSNQNKGKFSWTEIIEEGRMSAFNYSQNCEGIDVRQGILYFTCKKEKSLFILDLDEGTFERSSTKSGAFDNGPDQVARLLGDDAGAILYFCEDGGDTGTCGVHGRDANGKFYTILESHDEAYIGETSGLAFSPDNMHMYVSFQKPGIIFDITRIDMLPFGGQRLDIKYHEDEDNVMQR